MRRLLVLALLGLTGCPVPSDLCGSVKCGPGRVCVPEDGTCIVDLDGGNDGGATGGGNATGGGAGGGTASVDAGHDCPNNCGNNGGVTDAGVCDRSTGTCVGCLSYLDCACPTLACNNSQCVTIESLDAGNRAPNPGEACADASPLTFPHCSLPATFTYPIDLTGRSDDVHGSCGPVGGAGAGRDLVFALTFAGTYDITIHATPKASGVSPVLYLRDINCLGGSELDCKTSFNSDVALHFKSLAAGTYWLVVDSYDSTSAGPVDLSITLSEPTTPANETCALAASLLLSGLSTADGGLTDGGITVDLSTASDDESTSCNTGSINSPDVVYAFTTTAAVDLVVNASGARNPDGGSGITGVPVFELRKDACLPTDRVACRSQTNGQPPSLRVFSAPAGTYYVVLEAQSQATAGWVSLNVTAQEASSPPSNETCATARQLSLPSDGGSTFSFDVDTSIGSDDESSVCGSNLGDGGVTPPFDGGNPEYVYRVNFPSQRHVTVSAVPADIYTDPILYSRTTMCEGGPEACINASGPGQTESLSSGTVPAGDWFLFVESTKAAAGLIHVTVTATP